MSIITIKKLFDDLNKGDDKYNKVITLHVSTALSLHPQILESNIVEQTYNLNKQTYFNAYLNSPYYHHRFILNQPATNSIHIQRFLSVYLYEESKGNEYKFIHKCSTIGFKKVVDYVDNNEILDVVNILDMYKKINLSNITETYKTSIIGLMLYLGLHQNRKIVFNQLLESVIHNFSAFESDLMDTRFINKKEEVRLPYLNKLQSTLGFKVGKENILDNIISEHEVIIGRNLSKAERTEFLKKTNFDIVYKRGLLKYWKPLTAVLRSYEFDEMNFDTVPISREELIDICTLFHASVELERLTEEDFEFYLVASLCNVMMAKQYRNLQQAYQEQFEKDSGIDNIKQQQSYKFEKEAFLQNERDYKKAIAKQGEKIKAQSDEIESLQRQLKELQQQTTEDASLKKEVIALRSHIFAQDNELEQDIEEDVFNQSVAFLKDKKIAIIGGHPKWHQKLKSYLPSIRTVTPDELNIDLKFIDHMDIICFETSYNNHGQYYRTLKYMSQSDKPFMYINQKNVESIILAIASHLK